MKRETESSILEDEQSTVTREQFCKNYAEQKNTVSPEPQAMARWQDNHTSLSKGGGKHKPIALR